MDYLVAFLSVVAMLLQTPAPAFSACTMLHVSECGQKMQALSSNSTGAEGGQSMKQVMDMCQAVIQYAQCLQTTMDNCESGDEAVRSILQQSINGTQESSEQCQSCDWGAFDECVESNEAFISRIESFKNENVSVSNEDCGKLKALKICIENVQCSNDQINEGRDKQLAEAADIIKNRCTTGGDGANVVRSSSVPVVLVLLSALLKLLF